MTAETDRLSRAGSYVLGLMSESDRERAERDLEIDPAFRDAVVQVAERMAVLDFAPQKDADPSEQWKLVADRIGELPQMRRRAGTPAIIPVSKKVETVGQGLHAIPSRRALIYAVSLIAAFAAGYLVALLR